MEILASNLFFNAYAERKTGECAWNRSLIHPPKIVFSDFHFWSGDFLVPSHRPGCDPGRAACAGPWACRPWRAAMGSMAPFWLQDGFGWCSKWLDFEVDVQPKRAQPILTLKRPFLTVHAFVLSLYWCSNTWKHLHSPKKCEMVCIQWFRVPLCEL